MFRKIFITILLLLPIALLFIGYPISKKSQEHIPFMADSQRCFAVGNDKQFFSCFTKPKQNSLKTVQQVIMDMNAEEPLMGYFFMGFVIIQIVVIYFIVSDIEDN